MPESARQEDIFLFVATTLLLVAFTGYLWAVLFKIRFQVYRPLIVVLVSYQVTILVRWALNSIKIWKSFDKNVDDYRDDYLVIILRLVFSLFQRIKNVCIIYFVLQTKEVNIKLVSTSHEDYHLRIKYF
jgi:hypothetical protein